MSYAKRNFKSGATLYASDLNAMDEQIYKNATEKIDNPSTGAVGQILEIESVDENGKPKTYKAVDKPQGGGEVSDEQISDAVRDYLTENPPEVGESVLFADSVDWNYPELDIWNRDRMRNATLLSAEGKMAHNASACGCGNLIANVWTENTSGGTGDNFNSAGVHTKLRFTTDFYGIGWKSHSWKLDVDSSTYDIFPEGTEIVGLDGNAYSVVTDSDNMILYVNNTLHIFSMVKGSDGKVHFVHTSGTPTRSNHTFTWVPSNVFTEITLIVDGDEGAYDFKRINSEWESPQINTNPCTNGTDVQIALSVNGKGIAIISFPTNDVTKWTYKTFIERDDIYLEACMKRVNWISNNYPTIAVAYRTKKGYAKILGLNSNYEVLQEYAMPASNTRVTLLYAENNLYLITGNSGRSTTSVYRYELVGTPNLSKPERILHLDTKITDYVSGFGGGNGNGALYLIGTNGFAQNKGGVYCNSFIHNNDNNEYVQYINRMYNLIKNPTVTQTLTEGTEIGSVCGTKLYAPTPPEISGASETWSNLANETLEEEKSGFTQVNLDEAKKIRKVRIYCETVGTASAGSSKGLEINGLFPNDKLIIGDGVSGTDGEKKYWYIEIDSFKSFSLCKAIYQSSDNFGEGVVRSKISTDFTCDSDVTSIHVASHNGWGMFGVGSTYRMDVVYA